MPELKVRRLGYALGAEVTGIDLRKPLDDATVRAVRQAWLEHLLLCFPNQELAKKELLAFAGRFGEFEPASRNVDPENANVILLTHKPVNGKPWDGYKNGHNWHSDHSYTTHPTSGTFITCKEIPEAGGDTMFANLYMAYESLSPAMKELVEELAAIHVLSLRDRSTPAGAHQNDERNREETLQAEKARAGATPPTVQPVVRIHPETKRKALYLGEKVRRFVGMTEEESLPLLEFLNQQAVKYEFTYRHRWHVNDLIMWDNRCLLHIALCDYDMYHDARDMLRCAIVGEPSGYHYTESAESALIASL